MVAAAVLSCVAHTPSAAAPHAHTARQHGAATDDAWSPIGAYTNSLNPTGVPTGLGKPDGGGWGYGCTSICQGEFDNIEDLFDDFVATSYKTLQTSFETVGSEVENIVSDAAALVLAKVQAKATAVSHQHARLDATYKVSTLVLYARAHTHTLRAFSCVLAPFAHIYFWFTWNHWLALNVKTCMRAASAECS